MTANPAASRYQPPLDAYGPIPGDLSDAIAERDACLQVMNAIEAVTPIARGERLDPERADWRRRAKVTRRLAEARYRVLKEHVKQTNHQVTSQNDSARLSVIRSAQQLVDLMDGEFDPTEAKESFARLRTAVRNYASLVEDGRSRRQA